MRTTFRVAHRYLSLACAAVWILQALTGVLLVFHRPVDDWTLGASAHPTNPAAIDAALGALRRARPGAIPIEFFPSGGVPGQIDVLFDEPGAPRRVLRIDGTTGVILRESAWEAPLRELAPARFILVFHKQLLAGQFGHWFIGVSGLLLFTNLLMGLRLAWPARGRWRATLLPAPAKSRAMTVLGWHRAMGLCLAPFGLMVALTGAGMVWTAEIEAAIAAGVPPVRAAQAAPRPISVAAAETVALGVYPGAALAEVNLPVGSAPYYTVRLRRSGEWRRVFGTTVVYVDARDGAVLGAHDALRAPFPQRLVDSFYPWHTGEWGGLATRLLTMLVGLWLAATASFGVFLWWVRRHPQKRKARNRILPPKDSASQII